MKRNYEAEFEAQKPILKPRKIKPGTWLEVRWTDAPNEIVLALENHIASVDVYAPKRKGIDHRIGYDQIVRVVGLLAVPK